MSSLADGVSIGRQVLRREVNSRMQNAFSSTEAETLDVLCECGHRFCATRVQVGVGFYEGLVASGRLFVVADDHLDKSGEVAVGEYEGFVVVERARA